MARIVRSGEASSAHVKNFFVRKIIKPAADFCVAKLIFIAFEKHQKRRMKAEAGNLKSLVLTGEPANLAKATQKIKIFFKKMAWKKLGSFARIFFFIWMEFASKLLLVGISKEVYGVF